MHVVNDSTEESKKLNAALKLAYQELQSYLPEGESQILEAQSVCSFENHFDATVCLITEGTATIVVHNRPVFHVNEGDFIGFPSERRLGTWELRTDFAIKVTAYALSSVQMLLQNNAKFSACWYEIQTLQATLFLSLFAEQCKSDLTIFPALRFFSPGEEIVREGEAATEVFTLIEGGADVVHNSVPVGVIEEDEIFGALGALTGIARTATVIARDRCTVAVLPVACFRNLIQSKPLTVEKLISDYARKILQLNSMVAGRSQGRTLT